MNIFLHVPAEISYELVSRKSTRSYTDKKHDEHEGDINHLRKTVETYEQLCKLFPKDFKIVKCTEKKRLLSIPAINNLIWDVIKPILPKPQNKPQSRMIRLDKALPEQQPAPANPIIISTTSSQNDLLKTSLKGLSLLEARRFLKTLTTKSRLVVPKRPSSQSLFIPSGMPAKLTNTYRQTQMKILSNYQIISKTVGAELAHAVLPLSYITDVDVKGTSSQWLKLHLDMCEYPSAETIKLSSSLVKQLSKRWPSIFTKFSIASSDKFKPKPELLNQSASQSTDLILVSLTSPTPRNELDILIDAMYMSSDLSRSEIASNLDSLSYQQKSDSLSNYLKADSVERETLIGKISYELDLITSGVELVYLLGLEIFEDVQI